MVPCSSDAAVCTAIASFAKSTTCTIDLVCDKASSRERRNADGKLVMNKLQLTPLPLAPSCVGDLGCIFPFNMGMGVEYSECTDASHIGAEHQDPDSENTGTSESWCATQVGSGAEEGKVEKWRYCNNCV